MSLRPVSPPVLAELGTRLSRPTEPLWTVATNSWQGRDDWLRTLSKSRRSNVRAMSRRIEQTGRVVCRTDAGGGDLEPAAVTELVRANARKYGGRVLPPAAQLTEHLAVLLRRPDVISLRYTDNVTGELLGFGTIFDHPEWPVWRHWAMVPLAAGGVRDLYFHHFGRMVEWAVTHRKRGIVLGKGNGAVKQSLGGSPAEQYAVAVPGW